MPVKTSLRIWAVRPGKTCLVGTGVILAILFPAFGGEAFGSEVALEDDPILLAYDTFVEAPAETKIKVIESIQGRVEGLKHPIVDAWLAIGRQARRKLKAVAAEGPEFYDPNIYASGQNVTRTMLGSDNARVLSKIDVYRCLDNAPQFVAEVVYNFGTDRTETVRVPLKEEEVLWNFLYGLPRDVDYIVAFLSKEYDHDKSMDARAAHFSHLYCDLEGNAYSGVTLFDAFSSREEIDMPDVDVIPFARKIAKDRSFVSPIPAGSKRARLYEDIKQDFLKYFQYRTYVETAANIWLNPDYVLRPEQENLRERVLYGYFLDDSDVTKFAKRMAKAKDREGYINMIDSLNQKDKSWRDKAQRYRRERNQARSAVIEETHAVLREFGFLKE